MNWIVLIGPPAVGKTSLACKLQKITLNSRIVSFDNEFPLKRIIESGTDSRSCRLNFIHEIIAKSSMHGESVFIDDTCHLRAIQKLYLKLKHVKVVFLYISAKNDEIPILQERNSKRITDVTAEEIDKMTSVLNSQKVKHLNMVEYNFLQMPDDCFKFHEALNTAFANYKAPIQQDFGLLNHRDIQSDNNFYNKLNLALSQEINNAFKTEPLIFDGALVAKSKRDFIQRIKQQPEIECCNIEELVEMFKFENL
jgi:shikimate kinase